MGLIRLARVHDDGAARTPVFLVERLRPLPATRRPPATSPCSASRDTEHNDAAALREYLLSRLEEAEPR